MILLLKNAKKLDVAGVKRDLTQLEFALVEINLLIIIFFLRIKNLKNECFKLRISNRLNCISKTKLILIYADFKRKIHEFMIEHANEIDENAV